MMRKINLILHETEVYVKIYRMIQRSLKIVLVSILMMNLLSIKACALTKQKAQSITNSLRAIVLCTLAERIACEFAKSLLYVMCVKNFARNKTFNNKAKQTC